MRILQPAEWSKPRGFSHGVEVDASGKWIVLAGQTGGDEKGDYAPDMAAQVGTALKRIIKLLGEAGAGPEHIVRLTWYLTSRSEYEAAGPASVQPGGDTRAQFPAIDIAHRGAGRSGQGRNRSHRLRAQGLTKA
jgi:enamine deaminase RidA (YjgF/YER057c/UK114 family)